MTELNVPNETYRNMTIKQLKEIDKAFYQICKELEDCKKKVKRLEKIETRLRECINNFA